MYRKEKISSFDVEKRSWVIVCCFKSYYRNKTIADLMPLFSGHFLSSNQEAGIANPPKQTDKLVMNRFYSLTVPAYAYFVVSL
ncbi:MAG: hypothetical protein WCP32_04615 [Bacteroidota bacterium]